MTEEQTKKETEAATPQTEESDNGKKQPVLRLRGLGKHFGNVVAVDNLE